jgi:hypothetical protein
LTENPRVAPQAHSILSLGTGYKKASKRFLRSFFIEIFSILHPQAMGQLKFADVLDRSNGYSYHDV